MFLDATRVFNSGGSGYLLDRKSLRLVAAAIATRDPLCSPDVTTSAEDVRMGECLAAKGILPVDSRDDMERERFHPFPPYWHLHYERGRTRW